MGRSEMIDPQTWLTQFARLCAAGHGKAIGEMFDKNGFWRDYLPFGWTLQTHEGREAIAAFGAAHGPEADFQDPVFEGGPEDTEGFFRFTTTDGPGRGYLRMNNVTCHTLFTQLDGLTHRLETQNTPSDPYVLVVGGGQGGLALGAQLADLGVPYLIIDRYPRVGDQWRSRYESLILHDPVWYDHLPFKPFPENWPVFTPKDQMGDWLEKYARELNLNIWTGTELTAAKHDEVKGRWRVDLNHFNTKTTLEPTHVVMALGLSGFPNVPVFNGHDVFAGPQMHSSAYKDGAPFAGKNVVVVGANNSAHDIASDLVRVGARPTLLQRSSSLIVRQQDYCDKIFGAPLFRRSGGKRHHHRQGRCLASLCSHTHS